MINSIIEAISVSLDAEFGYVNHMEEIKQDLEEPCFFISCLNPTYDLFLGKRYFRKNQFVIQYFPSTDEVERECNDVAERMNECLEYINVDGLIRGTRMNYRIVDGVLNYFVNYDCFVYKLIESEVMDTLELSTNVRDGD